MAQTLVSSGDKKLIKGKGKEGDYQGKQK